MKKAELIEHIADTAGISKSEATKALKAVETGITKTLKKEGRMPFAPIGTFKVSKRGPREGVTNGVKWKKPAHKAVTFKASTALKDAVN